MVAIYTLGCKVNQLESESIAAAFTQAGFQTLPWEPETPLTRSPHLVVINTCTVTSKAEQKARRVIRRVLREHPQTILVVTGCYAQMDPQGIRSLDPGGLPNRLFVIPGDKKSALLDLPNLLIPAQEDWSQAADVLSHWQEETPLGLGDPFCFNPEDFSFHSRAFLKIQDGCDNSCSYCRVCLARGPSLSLGAGQVLESLRALELRGYGEAVLTGVNISQYQDGSQDLAGLLEALLEGTRFIRLRLSSLEPDRITPGLRAVLRDPRIRPHFHLAVQSGSASVLERMGRRYTPELIEAAAEGLRDLREDPFLGCDIITGFPGETDEAFEATYQLCQNLDFAWIHGFPYSRRPGTQAYSFKESVPEREARVRVDRLLALGKEGRRRYIQRWQGKVVEGVAEAPGEFWVSAVSDNYLKLRIPLPEGVSCKAGSVLRCRILEAELKGSFDASAVLVDA